MFHWGIKGKLVRGSWRWCTVCLRGASSVHRFNHVRNRCGAGININCPKLHVNTGGWSEGGRNACWGYKLELSLESRSETEKVRGSSDDTEGEVSATARASQMDHYSISDANCWETRSKSRERECPARWWLGRYYYTPRPQQHAHCRTVDDDEGLAWDIVYMSYLRWNQVHQCQSFRYSLIFVLFNLPEMIFFLDLALCMPSTFYYSILVVVSFLPTVHRELPVRFGHRTLNYISPLYTLVLCLFVSVSLSLIYLATLFHSRSSVLLGISYCLSPSLEASPVWAGRGSRSRPGRVDCLISTNISVLVRGETSRVCIYTFVEHVPLTANGCTTRRSYVPRSSTILPPKCTKLSSRTLYTLTRTNAGPRIRLQSNWSVWYSPLLPSLSS